MCKQLAGFDCAEWRCSRNFSSICEMKVQYATGLKRIRMHVCRTNCSRDWNSPPPEIPTSVAMEMSSSATNTNLSKSYIPSVTLWTPHWIPELSAIFAEQDLNLPVFASEFLMSSMKSSTPFNSTNIVPPGFDHPPAVSFSSLYSLWHHD